MATTEWRLDKKTGLSGAWSQDVTNRVLSGRQMMPLLPELEGVFGLGSTTMSSLTGLKSRLDGVSPYRCGLDGTEGGAFASH
ncbi:MAG: hypothetical protein ABSG04_11170, partial [Verrucomicrobiota bacterium]